jgi:hypothetical protein
MYDPTFEVDRAEDNAIQEENAREFLALQERTDKFWRWHQRQYQETVKQGHDHAVAREVMDDWCQAHNIPFRCRTRIGKPCAYLMELQRIRPARSIADFKAYVQAVGVENLDRDEYNRWMRLTTGDPNFGRRGY